MELFALIIIVFVVIYCLVMIRWFLAWQLYPKGISVPLPFNFDKTVSVIVAVRNEESIITNLLECLELQNHKPDEIIISDDFSDDGTEATVLDFINRSIVRKDKFKYIKGNPGEQTGKKAALERAILHASGQVLVTTDADCKMGSGWISSILFHFRNNKIKMVLGTVKINPCNTIFQKLQALEFAGLSVSTVTSLLTNKPLMCNGANLAFLRTAFDESGGYSYGSGDRSGDDTYLMLSILKTNYKAVAYNSYYDGIVVTKPLEQFNDFLNQRIRWASKIKNYNEGYIKYTGVFLFCINVILVILPFCSLAGLLPWMLTAVIWVSKLLADFILLYPFLKFTGQHNLLFLFLPVELFHPIYSILGGIFSLKSKNYRWKGREIKTSIR